VLAFVACNWIKFEVLLDFFTDEFDDYDLRPTAGSICFPSPTLAFPRMLKRAVHQIDMGSYKRRAVDESGPLRSSPPIMSGCSKLC
jgi:hypothetical protein